MSFFCLEMIFSKRMQFLMSFCRKWDFFFCHSLVSLPLHSILIPPPPLSITSTTITTLFQMSLPPLFLLPRPPPPHHYLMQERSDNLCDNYVSGKCYLFYVSKNFLFVTIIWLKLFMEFSLKKKVIYVILLIVVIT